jgi:dTDP-4-dehydrorhamnose reductase
MNLIKKRIVFSGGKGRFGKTFQQIDNDYKIFYPLKSELDITKINTIRSYLKKTKPKYFIHCAALSRPMKIHYQNIKKSIDINIIGTCNIVKICQEYKIKLIFFSTNYVYPGFKGAYTEESPLLPFNNYGWSKLGGESAVRMYSNSLILRICMTEKPFVHKQAFTDLKTNFMFHDQLSINLLNLIDKKGILNIGGKIQTVYHFAKKFNKDIKKISAKKLYGKNYPLNQSMNVRKYIKIKKIIKN